MAEGSFRALACDGERAVSAGALIISPWPAHPYDLECRRAMIDWCKRKGLARVTLHASEDGRHLYESLGFESSNKKRLKLR
jgi:hypothetical protein